MLQKKDEKGFSLIELMIVVVIIGILASVSIPAYINHVRKARIAEAKANLGSIKIQQESYRAVNDAYLACPAHPTSVPGDTEGTWAGNAGFNAIGFAPSGGIWFQYEVTASADGNSFTATATGDLDDDTVQSSFTITNNSGITGTGDGIY